jgi:hypothetical protein
MRLEDLAVFVEPVDGSRGMFLIEVCGRPGESRRILAVDRTRTRVEEVREVAGQEMAGWVAEYDANDPGGGTCRPVGAFEVPGWVPEAEEACPF